MATDIVVDKKFPERKTIRQFIFNSQNKFDEIREKMRQDPEYWIYNGLRSSYFVG